MRAMRSMQAGFKEGSLVSSDKDRSGEGCGGEGGGGGARGSERKEGKIKVSGVECGTAEKRRAGTTHQGGVEGKRTRQRTEEEQGGD